MTNKYDSINLGTSGFAPTSFSSSVFKPLAPNVALLDKSLTTLAAKKDEITKGQAAIDQAFGQLEEKMYKDDETRQWLGEYKANIQNGINEKANEYDLYGAARQATKAAGELLSNGVIIDRLDDFTKFSAMEKEVKESKNYGKDVKDWWLATHPHDGHLRQDEFGNDIAYDHSDYNERPAAQIDYTEVIKTAQNTVKERSSKFSNSSGRVMVKNEKGELVPGPEVNPFDKSVDLRYVNFKSLFNAINSALSLTPGAKESMLQDFEVDNYNYNKALEEYFSATTELDRSKALEKINIYGNRTRDSHGKKLTTTDYIVSKFVPWVKSMSYENRAVAWGEHNFGKKGSGNDDEETPVKRIKIEPIKTTDGESDYTATAKDAFYVTSAADSISTALAGNYEFTFNGELLIGGTNDANGTD